MKKIILLLILIFVFIPCCLGADYTIDELQFRPARTVFLPKGTFVKITNVKEFSSQFIDEGDELTFISTYDVFMGETKLIPQKTVFYATVEKVREPLQGTNAAISIRVNKMVTPDGITYAIDGYVTSGNGNLYLGGTRTPALYYTRMPHYTQWKITRWKVGAAQYCETNTREYGFHTIVKSGAELILVLQDNFDLVQ